MRAKWNFHHLTASLRALALLMLLPTASHAGGFALGEFGARANGMGGAIIALADDASAVAYNPAGMTQLQGTRVMFGATAIAPMADVRTGSGASTTTQTNIYTPPHAYLVHQINDKAWFGLGIYTRFGLGTQYNVNWAGAKNIYRAELSSYSIAPNLALKLTDKLSFSFGPEILYSSADLRKSTAAGGTSDVRMIVSGISYGAQAGLRYEFNDQWSAGFVYHTSQQASDTGHAHYTPSPGFSRAPEALTISLTLPASYSLGIAFKPNENWKIEADAIFTQWQDYNKMKYSFEYSGTTISPKNWRNVWRFQLGTEYMATDWLALRAGFVWDQDPIRKGYEDLMLPSNDRKIYSTGIGIISDKFTYDFSLMYLTNNDRTMDKNTNIAATEITNSKAYMAGFSLGYKF
ncbi:MAG: outer membrane protein transport protein [Humidesulfovibrio sp.]|uniref:OmpP1/FadL family transporter n=1 Tax=Humidesulfovibrio sp. TaxID=2910988 RepID=UPI0027343685|nr:outer membrane protein transport protein [Humidesulfovibrio sp.]MDP2848934.1 outer membrane protein transport protein [Humidesulfovibrio sp.]